MGLDMYLSKRTYVKAWDHQKPEDRHAVMVTRGGKVRSDIKPERICEVIEEVAYWRKANAVHQWFVKHVQGGEDNCRPYYVSPDQLQQLKDACDKVLKASKTKPAQVNAGWAFDKDGTRELKRDGEKVIDTQIAETLLPTQGGFFFGCTDYDDGYIDDLQYTSETIAALLAEPEGGDFEYRASW